MILKDIISSSLENYGCYLIKKVTFFYKVTL